MTVTAREKSTATTGRRQSNGKGEGNPTAGDLARRSEAAEKEREDRIAAVVDAIGLVEIPLATAAAVEQRSIGPEEVGSFTLDIVALESHKVPLAEAISDLAESYPVLGAVLDKVAKATPFGALLSVAVSLGVQIAENHRILPNHLRGMSPNLVARDDLVDHLRAEAGVGANSQRKVKDRPQA